jgi:hypothetical protein
MERESFEDEEAAALLNGGFISIKVDREERPDVDRVYVSTGGGGLVQGRTARAFGQTLLATQAACKRHDPPAQRRDPIAPAPSPQPPPPRTCR